MPWQTGRRSRAGFWENEDVVPDTQHIRDRRRYEKTIYKILDQIGFNWRIYLVASLGFLSSSYSLFATNMISPALAYVYPNTHSLDTNSGMIFDIVTLSGTMLGMVVFGHLADRMGRKRLYGLELGIIVFATISIALSSEGYMAADEDPGKIQSTMDIYAAITWWRFLLGVGIGAEYPMSAVIAAEFVSTRVRGTTMAAVFLMQSVGRLLAFGLGVAFLQGYIKSKGFPLEEDSPEMKLAIDAVWRYVVGIAGVFALVAIGLRLTIPESPRYYVGIDGDLRKAAGAVKRINRNITAEDQRSIDSVDSGTADSETNRNSTPWLGTAVRYLRVKGWRRLATVSILWFLLDICFYGMGLDSPTVINLLWLNQTPDASGLPNDNSWQQYQTYPKESIYWILNNNAARTLEISSISSICGSLAIIPLINYVNRRKLLVWTSLALSVIFFITGALVKTKYATPANIASMIFYSLAQFTFNLGPNTIVYIMAAEVFPTMFRGTFFGVAAAFGKLGAICIRPTAILISKSNGQNVLAGLLFAYAVVMLVIACVASFESSLPEVQKPPKDKSPFTMLENMTLEEIAPNPQPKDLYPDITAQKVQNGGSNGSAYPMGDLEAQNRANHETNKAEN